MRFKNRLLRDWLDMHRSKQKSALVAGSACAILYVIVALYLVIGPPGGAGHGWGALAAYRIALPLSLLMPEYAGLPALLLLGAAQYFLVGFIGWLLKSR